MIQNQPFFSIIIPALNEEEYISKLLDSLKAQTRSDFEVIIVDGGSQDNTLAVVSRYKKVFPLTILESQKHNVGYQRNYGAQKGQGKYVVFFDADVYVKRDYLAVLASQLQKTRVDFASTWFVPDSTNPVDRFAAYFSNWLFLFYAGLGKPFMTGQNMIFKTEVFKKVHGYDTTVLHAEDIDLAQRAHAQGFKGKIFNPPVHYFSIRRLIYEGRLRLLYKYTRSNLHIFFNKGPIRKPLFTYDMGKYAEKRRN